MTESIEPPEFLNDHGLTDARITGIWIAPDQTMIAIQYNEDAIDVVSTEYAQLMDLEEAGLEAVGVPSDWLPLSPKRAEASRDLEWHVE